MMPYILPIYFSTFGQMGTGIYTIIDEYRVL